MICAYCKEDAPSTREHVIPAFIYRFQKELEANVLTRFDEELPHGQWASRTC